MTITTLGARFLAAFNDIEKHVRAHLKVDEHIGFIQLVRSTPRRGGCHTSIEAP
ncbi:hypothetical protein [Micromonospora craterilacus]|uniref:hypothetical protein n=1 Tax=Micromonospora craterilacus TaxID=1655439 RepID=UPI0013143C88|nr:hypothetical protein [Micromonospora craterilacus]